MKKTKRSGLSLEQRLKIIKGQIEGIERLIQNRENCKKVLEQFYAVSSALNKVIKLYLEEDIDSCLNSLDPKDRRRLEFLLEELIKTN